MIDIYVITHNIANMKRVIKVLGPIKLFNNDKTPEAINSEQRGHFTVMCFLLYLSLLLASNSVTKADDVIVTVQDGPIEALNLTVYEISDRLVTLFGLDYERPRIKDLQEKLEKINQYVVNHNLVADILTNVTNETSLNETNFYHALNENDYFRFLTANDSKNLYLKLKERMTRDDVLKIVAERGKKRMVKPARRMLTNVLPKKEDEEEMNDVVDKMLGEIPSDDHKLKANESIYWDPQGELEDRKTYHEGKRSGRRIFRGERTTIRYYPFMASVHVMGRFWCGAVLYWHDLCITSASCLQLMHNNRFFRENPRILQVRLGSNHSRIGGEMIDVLEVYFHPGYNPRTLKCNLAVIRLRRHLVFTYHRVAKLVAISHSPDTPAPTAEVLLLGWGVTKISQKLAYEPIFLQRKFIPVYPNSFCKEVYGDKFVTETMFCAGTLTTGEGACDHDAGGPAIVSGQLVGIISFGPSICGFADAPTVFTLVGAFSDWIETVNESMSDVYRSKARTTTTTKSPLNEFLATYKVGRTTTKSPLVVFTRPDSDETPTAAVPETEATELTVTTRPTTTTARTTTRTTPPPAPAQLREGYESDGGWSIDLK